MEGEKKKKVAGYERSVGEGRKTGRGQEEGGNDRNG